MVVFYYVLDYIYACFNDTNHEYQHTNTLNGLACHVQILIDEKG